MVCGRAPARQRSCASTGIPSASATAKGDLWVGGGSLLTGTFSVTFFNISEKRGLGVEVGESKKTLHVCRRFVANISPTCRGAFPNSRMRSKGF